jgi:hypothetical protein
LTSQARPYVSHRSEITFAGTGGAGAHPFSLMPSAPIVSEWARPEGTCVVSSQCPSQGLGASYDVLEPPGMLHAVVLAVSVEGSAHEPVGDSQAHASQPGGATRSACPS